MIIFAIVFGAFFGSMFATYAFRFLDGRKILNKNACSVCLEPVHALDSIPLISYFRLKGRCRSCSSVFAWQYPAIELISAIVFAGLVINFLGNPDYSLLIFARDIVVFSAAISIFIYDLRINRIPDAITVPALVAVIILNLYAGFTPEFILLGMLGIGSFFAIQYIASAGKLVGAGDVRVALLIGASFGLVPGIIIIIISYILAGLVGIYLIYTEKVDLHDSVPFGSFMAIAMTLMLLFNQQFQEIYLRIIENL